MQSQSKLAEIRVSKLAVNIVGTLLTLMLCSAGVMVARMLPHHIPFAEWHAFAVLACFVVLLPLHEALHAVGLLVFANVPRCHIRFGVMWRALMPYCHCTVPISVGAYRCMALLPLWVTGALSIASLLVFPADCLGAFAGIAVAACVGDVWMVCRLRAFDDTLLVHDSPSEIGCDVLSAVTELAGPSGPPNEGPATPVGQSDGPSGAHHR